MSHGHADVPQHRGVREVPLKPADGQLLGEVLQDRVGHAEVALRVLEVDGVHLVRHGTGADFAGYNLLLEVVHGHIHPDVPAHVRQDGVDPLHCVEDRAHVVVVLDLCGVLLPLQAELLRAEGVAEAAPVDVGEGHQVGVHVACGASELARVRNRGQQLQLPLDALDVHLELLGQVGRRGRLSVGFGEHGEVPLRELAANHLQNALNARQISLFQRILEKQRD
mmetsp:Transcript_127896/g.408966  ORF Transcript_127896/g.408966 Transcript_127896/m.408966 type:complete len:223 (+) Transcript_127896:471-1139(+)